MGGIAFAPGGRRTPRTESRTEHGVARRSGGIQRVSIGAKGSLAVEGRVRLRPRLPVRAWKTHASKWDYIKGRFIITASRASGAGAGAEVTSPPRAIFQQTKVIRSTIRARGETPIWRGIYLGHRLNLINGPRRPCLQSQCNGRGVPYFF